MKTQNIQQIPVTKIGLCPWNPREQIEGPALDELVASIKEKEVLQPVLVRPTGEDTYELVFGERRFRAVCEIAFDGEKPDAVTIPALIRELSDDDAFEMMIMENLQRENLSELEEAKAFQAYLDRHSKDEDPALTLGQRVSKDPPYIRRRVRVLGLPKQVLKAWGEGKIKYGYVEQLCRLNNKKRILEFLSQISNNGMTIAWLKQRIDSESPSLRDALFELKDAGCLVCRQNSDVQKQALGDAFAMKKKHCLNGMCFKQKQHNWLSEHWKQSKYHKELGTNGFRFDEDLSWGEYEGFYTKAPKKCQECPDFVSLLHVSGQVQSQRVCVGPKDCFQKSQRSAVSKNKAPSEPTRPNWHGEYFREQFYHTEIPRRLADVKPDDEKIRRLALISLLHSNQDLREWFAREYIKKEKEEGDYFYISNRELWQGIANLSYEQVEEALKQATVQVTLQGGFGPAARHLVGTYLGLDLSRDWQVTEEYLDKKTIKEILAMGEEFGVFKDQKVQTFLYETLLKKRGSFKGCKKTELKRVFLESGVDLAGKVPAEILKDIDDEQQQEEAE